MRLTFISILSFLTIVSCSTSKNIRSQIQSEEDAIHVLKMGLTYIDAPQNKNVNDGHRNIIKQWFGDLFEYEIIYDSYRIAVISFDSLGAIRAHTLFNNKDTTMRFQYFDENGEIISETDIVDEFYDPEVNQRVNEAINKTGSMKYYREDIKMIHGLECFKVSLTLFDDDNDIYNHHYYLTNDFPIPDTPMANAVKIRLYLIPEQSIISEETEITIGIMSKSIGNKDYEIFLNDFKLSDTISIRN